MIKRLFICRSYYHIYNAIKGSKKNIETTIICISKQFDKKKLIEMVNRGNFIFNNIKFIIVDKCYKEINGILEKNYDEVYFFHWNLYKSIERFVYRRYKRSQIFMIEDGVSHYDVFNKDKMNKKIYIKYIINYMLIGKKDLVLQENVEKIYVSEIEKYPNYMTNKLVSINEFHNNDDENNLNIVKLFDINISNVVSKKNCIVFTQPLSEDGYIDELKKIEVYSNIVNYMMNNGYQVIIKNHPRDNSKYKFGNSIIKLNKDFPAEILNFLEIKFNIAISVCSGIIYNIDAKHKIQIIPEFFTISRHNDIEYKFNLDDYIIE